MKIKNIELIIYDFDGVMTDNKVYFDQNGIEMVQVNRADGLGVSEIKKLDINQIIISTEKNPVVSMRAKKLGIFCLQGIEDKELAINNYCEKNNIKLDRVLFVGNDINDKKAMELSGVAICPNDAHESIKFISDYVLNKNGGDGIVRELLDLLIN
jgi:3-deoxy-D-manno-octulosonate 8-phosphate phosphatase (KDO 8-P phosphatase)